MPEDFSELPRRRPRRRKVPGRLARRRACELRTQGVARRLRRRPRTCR